MTTEMTALVQDNVNIETERSGVVLQSTQRSAIKVMTPNIGKQGSQEKTDQSQKQTMQLHDYEAQMRTEASPRQSPRLQHDGPTTALQLLSTDQKTVEEGDNMVMSIMQGSKQTTSMPLIRRVEGSAETSVEEASPLRALTPIMTCGVNKHI